MFRSIVLGIEVYVMDLGNRSYSSLLYGLCLILEFVILLPVLGIGESR